MCDAVNRAAAAGIGVVAAAGNRGPWEDTIDCPGVAEGAITVGATWNANEEVSYHSLPEQERHRWFGTSYASGTLIL